MMIARHEREAEFHDSLSAKNSRKAAEKYYSVAQSSDQFFREFLESHGRGKSVLEYGCGYWGSWYGLVGKASSITGIDVSSVAIQQARKDAQRLKVEDFRFLQMEAEDMQFADSTFDMIFGRGILHHLDLERSFRELSRTLKPDGFAIFWEPLGHNPLINLHRRLTPQRRTEDEHPLLITDLKFAESYFRKVDAYFFHLFALLAVPFRGRRFFSKILTLLDGLDAYLFRTCPPARRFAWIVVVVLSEPRRDSFLGSGNTSTRDLRVHQPAAEARRSDPHLI